MKINFSILFACFLIACVTQPLPTQQKNETNYESMWQNVSELEKQGLSKSAQELVRKIFDQSLLDKEYNQVVKASIHIAKYRQELDEHGLAAVISEMESLLPKIDSYANSLVHSILGELYEAYFNQNLGKLSNRMPGPGDMDNDMNNWSGKKLIDTARTHYFLSLENKKVTAIPLKELKELIIWDKGSEIYNPSLRFLLLERAISFLKKDHHLPFQKPENYLFDPSVFKEDEQFVNISFIQPGDLYRIVRLYQEKTQVVIEQGSKALKVKNGLDRLGFVFSQSIHADREIIYEQALEDMRLKYRQHPEWTIMVKELVEYYLHRKSYFTKTELSTIRQKALKWCQNAIEKYPDSPGANWCRQQIDEIKRKSFQLICNAFELPDVDWIAKLTYRNSNHVFVSVYAIQPAMIDKLEQDGNPAWTQWIKSQNPVNFWRQRLIEDGDYLEHSTEIKMPALTSGTYLIVVKPSESPDEGYQRAIVQISRWSYITGGLQRRNWLAVVDRETGEPVEDAEVQLFINEYDRQTRRNYFKPLQTHTTSSDGLIWDLSSKGGIMVKISKNGDTLYNRNTLFFPYYPTPPDREFIQTYFFCDRPVYRPGQRIYIKGLIVKKDNRQIPQILAGVAAKLVLRDPNGEIVQEKELRSNSFGSISSSFIIPKSRISGRWRIESNHGGIHYFRVEAYKRQKFAVTLNPPQTAYHLGAQGNITGSAMGLSGNAINNALVKYRVFRSYRHTWRNNPYLRYPIIFDRTFLGDGMLKTGHEGEFSIPISFVPDAIIPQKLRPTFNFEVEVEVTDVNGETNESNLHVLAKYDAFKINIEVLEKTEWPEKVLPKITHLNYAGKPLQGEGTWKLIQLKKPANYLRKRSWPAPDRQILAQEEWRILFPKDAYGSEDNYHEWTTERVVDQSGYEVKPNSHFHLELEDLEVGAYCLEVTSSEDVKQKKYFYIWHRARPFPIFDQLELFTSKQESIPGEKLQIHLLSAKSENWVLFQVDQLSHEKLIWLQNTNSQPQEITIHNEDRGNFGMVANIISDNRFQVVNKPVQVPWNNKELTIKLTTFRPTLLPGSVEKWELQVLHEDAPVKNAEVTTSMYDASLDFIETLHWPQKFYPNYYQMPVIRNQTFRTANSIPAFNRQRVGQVVFPGWFRLNWFGYYPGARLKRLYKTAEAVESVPPPEAHEVQSQKSEDSSIKEVAEEEVTEVPLPVPRRNLNETVFFYGNLNTNDQGKVSLDFTMNEALTSWTWKVFVHTPDLKTGSASETIITKKDLMVFPNFPRFVREGDEIQLPVKITNLKEEVIQGQTWIELFNPDQKDKTLHFVASTDLTQDFSIPSGQSKNFSWIARIPEHYTGRLGYRVWARSGDHQDGEENSIPVLSRKIWITETMPIAIKGNQQKQWSFESYLEHWNQPGTWSERFVIEMTPNPIWLAIKSLPYLTTPVYETSENLATQYFAQRLGSEIVRKNPLVKSQIKTWISNDEQGQLVKNQELKIVQLQQTPWVAEANQETENIRNLGLLLDENQVKNELRSIWDKMVARQNPDGGFPWCAQGRSNFYITLSILDVLMKLQEYQLIQPIDQQRLDGIAKQTTDYLDEVMLKRYRELKKNNRLQDFHPGGNELLYLGLKQKFETEGKSEVQREMEGFLKDQFKKFWLESSLYTQAKLGLLMIGEDPQFANAILKSLLEKSLVHEELGRHWSKIGGYSWWQQPVITQTAIIRFLLAMQAPTEIIDECRIWLLKNKQTNRWENSLATAEAILALMGSIDRELETENRLMVQAGAQEVKSAEVNPGSQYWKRSWSKENLTAGLGEIRVENKADGIAWGAAYWQYFRDIDQIDNSGSDALRIARDLYKIGSEGESLELQSSSEFAAGDRVRIRLTLKNDRDMEFVMLEDTRGSGFEPTSSRSEYVWKSGLGFYKEVTDVSTRFFISFLPKGTHILEYEIYLAQFGRYSGGLVKAQNFYAPEFNSVAGSPTYSFNPLN